MPTNQKLSAKQDSPSLEDGIRVGVRKGILEVIGIIFALFIGSILLVAFADITTTIIFSQS